VYKGQSKITSLGEAAVCYTGHCPETSRDAKGYTRWGRLKAPLKVAGKAIPTTYSAEAQPERLTCRIILRDGIVAFEPPWYFGRFFIAWKEVMTMDASDSDHIPLDLFARSSAITACHAPAPVITPASEVLQQTF
jgi:hypothetical protein